MSDDRIPVFDRANLEALARSAPEAAPPERTPEAPALTEADSLRAKAYCDAYTGTFRDWEGDGSHIWRHLHAHAAGLRAVAECRADLVRAATTGSPELQNRRYAHSSDSAPNRRPELSDAAAKIDQALAKLGDFQPTDLASDDLLFEVKELLRAALRPSDTTVEQLARAMCSTSSRHKPYSDYPPCGLCRSHAARAIAALRSSAPATATEPVEALRAAADGMLAAWREYAVEEGDPVAKFGKVWVAANLLESALAALGSSAPAPGGATEDALAKAALLAVEYHDWLIHQVPAGQVIGRAFELTQSIRALRAADRTREDAGEPANSGEAR